MRARRPCTMAIISDRRSTASRDSFPLPMGAESCSRLRLPQPSPRFPSPASPCDLGAHGLKDLKQAETTYQVVADGLYEDFPGLASLDAHPQQPAVSDVEFCWTGRGTCWYSPLPRGVSGRYDRRPRRHWKDASRAPGRCRGNPNLHGRCLLHSTCPDRERQPSRSRPRVGAGRIGTTRRDGWTIRSLVISTASECFWCSITPSTCSPTLRRSSSPFSRNARTHAV